MKKIDLHIHTINTESDREFIFAFDILKQYVENNKLDAIAITNHNCFDLKQFQDISTKLSDITTVFPGIEINIGKGPGHMLIIAETKNVQDFNERCRKVKDIILTAADGITVEQLLKIFPNINEYLLIPHIDKKPSVDENTLFQLKSNLVCGEVGSVKKFSYYQKNIEGLTPVFFSDFRPEENCSMPLRSIFVDTNNISLSSLKICFQDKSKVSLTEDVGKSLFQALPNLKLSTGLNVIMGERSSGKSYTLNCLNANFENVKYIRQFQLLEPDPEKGEEEFKNKIARKQATEERNYFLQFSRIVDEIKDISQIDDEFGIEQYITSLIKHAKETSLTDSFAKCSLYSDSAFLINDQKSITKIIQATQDLLDSIEYKEIISEHIKRDDLLSLFKALVLTYQHENEVILKKLWVNDLVEDIKQKLQARTAATRVADVDSYKVQMDKCKISKFNKVALALQSDSVIDQHPIGSFIVQTKRTKYDGAGEMKKHSGKMIKFSEAYDAYLQNPYLFLQKLKDISELSDAQYYEYFAKVEYSILNQYGCKVSGGERAEFNLLQEINDAYQYDLLLIDEPESSFDNIFLKQHVNNMLKNISKELPVVIVTHNNTVGASIHPDYVINTVRTINGKTPSYDLYFGAPESKLLTNSEGEKINNLHALLNCLEAGEEAYEESPAV